jgi:hypothetical protein
LEVARIGVEATVCRLQHQDGEWLLTDWYGRHEARAAYAALGNLGQPDRIQLAGLGPPGHILDVPDIHPPSGVRVRDNRSQFFRLTHPLLCGWVNDLSRDGIRVDAPGHRMPTAVRYAALPLEVLGIHAEAPAATVDRLQHRVSESPNLSAGCR